MNNNVNNINQDMIIKEKIEKREKIDTILAYILIIILVACIGVVLGLKFLGNKEEEVPPADEYVPNYIGLNDISNSLNSSALAGRYMNEGATLSSSVNGNAILVTYNKDNILVDLNIPMIGNELMINVSEENKNIITEIYKEIANIICMYYGNEEKYCRYTLDNIDETGTEGIRFDNNGNNSIIYIETTKSFNVVNEIVYNDVVVTDINDTDYTLEMMGVSLSNINITSNDTTITFKGNFEIVSEDKSQFNIVVKLYDENNNTLNENKYEYNNDNSLDSNNFEITFPSSDTIQLENINKYSIEIVK